MNLAGVGPAPRAARILADFGMSVINVSPVAREGAKQIEPNYHAYGAGRGMQKISLDLKSDEGKEVFYNLAAKSDVVMESYRPGVATRLGVGYEDVKKANSSIVYCSISGYGQSGPYSQWAGHDINYLAVSGFLACSGTDSNDIPTIPGATVADSAGGGMHAAISIISSLLNRFRTGESVYLDVAVADGVLSLMSLHLDQYTATGRETIPKGELLTGAFGCYSVYKTNDGGAVAVGAIEGHFFHNLCRLLELEEYIPFQYDLSKQDEIKGALEEKFLTQNRDFWSELLAAHDTCVTPVLSIAEVSENEHLAARKSFMKAVHPAHGQFTQLAPILAGCDRDRDLFQMNADDETDADEILKSAGYSHCDIVRMKTINCVE